MSHAATPMPPMKAEPTAAAYMMPIRIPQSTANAQKRALSPAGRNSRRMPSGVSAVMAVSSMPGPRACSGFDDDGVGKLVVDALARFGEDEQGVDQPVQRDEAERHVHEVAQQENAADGRRRSVAPDD